MSYTKITDYAAKDALATGNASKLIKGTELGAEFDAIATADALNLKSSAGSFSSATLASALTDETGSGAAVFATSPTLVTPLLGTPTSGTLTNCTGYLVTTLGTEQASTSGTAIDFTGIPAGIKKITIMFSGVSLSGSDSLLVQIGDAGGIETTGYVGSSGSTTFTSGFGFAAVSASTTIHGALTLFLADSATFKWVASGSIGFSGNTAPAQGNGSKALSAELDRVRITTNGTNTFDAGAINIQYSA